MLKCSYNNQIVLTLILYALSSPFQQAKCKTEVENTNVLYYGWFFDEQTALALKEITASYFNEYLETNEFNSFIRSAMVNTSITDPFEFYKKPVDSNTGNHDPYYHVTAQYCGNVNCSSYSEKVESYINKTFEMELIGLAFTNRTYGIRVQLTQQQKLLFTDNECVLNQREVEDGGKWKMQKYKSIHSEIEFQPQETNLSPSISKAHITVGCAPGVQAVTTGTDLCGIVKMELDEEMTGKNITTPSGLMVQYGEWEAFVIYPKDKILANATFLPYYQPRGAASTKTSGVGIIVLTVTLYFVTMYYKETSVE